MTRTTTSAFGTTTLVDAAAKEDTTHWTVAMIVPFPMTPTYPVTIVDDTMTGKVRAGDLGTSLLTGLRVRT